MDRPYLETTGVGPGAGQESSVGGDPAAAELKLQAEVEIEPLRKLSGFTRRVRRAWPVITELLH